MTPRARIAAMVVIVLIIAGVGIERWRHHSRTGGWLGPSPEEPAASSEPAVVEWCAPGLDAVPGGGCFAAPADALGTKRALPLIIYLHGIFDPAAASEELDRQARVAEHGVSHGFAVLALRGHVGQCSAPEYANRVCWPSNEKNQDAGPSFVTEWKSPLAEAMHRNGRGRRYVLGFSNGGYFAGLLAERGWFDAAGFVVSRAGPVEPVVAGAGKRPMLLTLSEEDPSHDEMMKLDLELGNAAWPHEVFVSEGGHALPNADIDAAIAFFSKEEHAAGDKADKSEKKR